MTFDGDFNLDEIIGDPNGPAYQKTERRTGPPLSYIAEKFRGSLESLHSLLKELEKYVPDDLPQPNKAKGTLFSTKQDGLISPAWSAFRYGLVAYLALNNMLGVANDHDLFDRLLSFSMEDFMAWLDRIDSEGLVNG